MLIILGGVQASGKTTIQLGLQERFPDMKVLPRSEELKQALIHSPRDIGTDNHLNTLQQILNSWTNILENATGDTSDVYLLDAGPITTLTYNVLTLQSALSSKECWDHYLAHREKVDTPAYKYTSIAQMQDLYEACRGMCYDYFKNVFLPLAHSKCGNINAVYLNTSADEIRKRFEERRSDIRVNNMQDWYRNKEEEMQTYSHAYSVLNCWDLFSYNFTHSVIDTSCDLSSVIYELESKIRGSK